MNMLNKIRKNDRGASLIVALVVFIIASIICVTIVNAAVLNVGRASSEVDEERAYLATTSAAKLLKECIGDASYVIDNPYIVSSPSDLSDPDEPEKGKIEGIDPNRENIKAVLKEMALAVYSGGSNSGTSVKDISITAPDMPTVTGKLRMTAGYELTAEINVTSDDSDSDESYPITVHFRSAWNVYELENKKGLTYPDGNEFEGTVKTTSVSWPLDGVYITRNEKITP